MEEFKEITREETIDTLPPVRGIEHQIDFIPGSPLSNLPHHRLSLREAEILQE